jgi:hypothetical protein
VKDTTGRPLPRHIKGICWLLDHEIPKETDELMHKDGPEREDAQEDWRTGGRCTDEDPEAGAPLRGQDLAMTPLYNP